MKKLLIGLGNAYCGDDAIGIEVARRLEMQHRDWHTLTGALDGFNFLDAITGYDRVLVIDALINDGTGAVAGEIVEVKLEDFAGLAGSGYIHGMTMAQAYETGKKLGLDLPRELKIIGITVTRRCDYGDAADPRLLSRIDAIVGKIEEEVRRWKIEM